MSDAYVFYCSKCKVDHAGECPPASDPFFGIHRSVAPNLGDTYIDSGKTSILDALRSLADALDAGRYNAAPTTLHQCSLSPPCGCGVVDDDDDDSFDDDLDDDTTALQVRNFQLRDHGDGKATLSYEVKLQYPIRYIPLMFYLDGV